MPQWLKYSARFGLASALVAVAFTASLLALRFAALYLVRGIADTMTRTPFEQLPTVGLFLVSCVAVAASVFALRRVLSRHSERASSASVRWVAVIGVIAALPWPIEMVRTSHQHHSEEFFTYGFISERRLGHFPYPAGNVETENRFGYEMLAHIGPYGTRECKPTSVDRPVRMGNRNPGERTIVMVGDSFVFGVGLKDDETLCWRVWEAHEKASPGGARFWNLGQPGANIFSYVETARYAVEFFDPDLVFVGLVIPDDAQPLDVNRHDDVARWLPFQIPAAILEPISLLNGLIVLLEVLNTDFALSATIDDGLRQLVNLAEESGVPHVVYINGRPQIETGGPATALGHPYRYYESLVERHASASPHVHSMGMLVAEPNGVDTYIPHDGHPTGEGNSKLAPFFIEALKAHLPMDG